MRAHVLSSFSRLLRVGSCRTILATPKYSSFVKNLHPRTMAYSVYEAGAPNSFEYRMYFRDSDGPISPFHDIPLFADKEKNVFNMVVEIPRWSNSKMEICTTEELNPIKQDIKKGKLRYVNHCFPYHGYIWNYGALPQTWEDPGKTDPHTGCLGDNDPIDVLEIGTSVAKAGEVLQVKVLGVMALIDEGETDWKVIAINMKDPLAEKMNDISDVDTYMPGLLLATHDWLRIYKIPDKKPPNEFAFEGKPKDKEFALKVIQETHEFWKDLINKKKENSKGLSLENITVDESPFKISQEEAQTIFKKAPPQEDPKYVDPSVNIWHFVDKDNGKLANL